MNFSTEINSQNSDTFLEWFLINYFAIDDDLVIDFICDGSNDKGIDGIYTDDENEVIYFFQSKFISGKTKTLGDTDLKEFIGSIDQFKDLNSIENITNNANNDLSNLLESLDLKNKVRYKKLGVFITNICKDSNADNYLKNVTNLEVYDYERLKREYITITESGIEHNLVFLGNKIKLIKSDKYCIAIVSVKELIEQLESGIKDSTIFDKNVRYSLGKKNKVATEIKKTLDEEPKNTILYHNGITIITTKIKNESENLLLQNCSIVNGCQSTIAFHANQNIPDDAKILLKIIETKDSSLTNKITRNTNNQNPIQIRDLKANHIFQKQLQENFQLLKIFYEIKRGEKVTFQFDTKIKNDHAAQLICAFHLGKPYIANEKAKLFRDYYQEIFSSSITAEYIALIKTVFDSIHFNNMEELGNITKHKRVNYFLLYTLGELGLKECIKNMLNSNDANFQELQSKVIEKSKKLYDESLKHNFKFIIEERNQEGGFDYRNFFRKKESIENLKNELKREYDKDMAKRENR